MITSWFDSVIPRRAGFFIAALMGTASIATAAAPTTAPAAPTTAPAAQFTSDAYGHNFIAESGQLTLQLDPGVRATGGQVQITDEQGRPLETLSIAAGSSAVTIPLPERGYYEISATITREGGEPLTARTSASVVGPLLPTEVRLASPFGFFSVRGDTPLPVVAGAGWNRLFIPLNGVEQDESGALKWWRPNAPGPKPVEPINGTPTTLKWVGVLMFPPLDLVAPEHRSKHNNHNVYPPVDWDGFAKRVEFAARHYAQWVHYFEPINEPDANWRGTDEELVRYHKVIADAVHAVDPDLQVVGPCLCKIDLPYLRKMAALGLFDHLDGLSLHPYANDAPPEGKWWSEVRALRTFLESIGKGEMPIVLSEYGWQTASGDWARPVDELTQARYAARSLTLLAAEQISAINYFCLRYEDPRLPWVQGWSVVEEDFSPRPSFAAIANLTRWLADVDGAGTVLQPAPDTYLVLFRKGSGSVAVAWTTRGESMLQIPGAYGRVSDMTGRARTPDERGMIGLSGSPTFIELQDAALPKIESKATARVVRGESVDLPGEWPNASLPAPLQLTGNRLTVPAEAPVGDYLVMARSAAGDWSSATVTVLPRFAVESAQVHWPQEDEHPAVRMQIRSFGETVRVLPVVRLDGMSARFGKRLEVPADAVVEADVVLTDLPLDRRWTGVAAAEGRVDGRAESIDTPLSIDILPGGTVASAAVPVDWSSVPAIGSRGWRPFGIEPGGTMSPEDCSATLQWAWGERGLHLRVVVRDDDHQQSKEPQQMWQQDSLQLAFDVDYDLPWRPNVNNEIVGLNGHRIFEYGVALKDGTAQTTRWRDSIVKLPDDVPAIEADVVRDGDLTTYELLMPWPVLGLTEAPSAGSSIGFDLVVNDVDAEAKRHGLEIFGGINASKDPQKLGRLLLRRR